MSGPAPRRTAVAAALAAGLGLVLAPGASAQKPQTFPGEVDRVMVDAVVLDKAGNPVAGLSREDFTILEDGVRREIATFEAIQGPAGDSLPAPSAAAVSNPPRPRIATNTGPRRRPARFFLILFDNLHLTPLNAQRARAAVLSFLDKAVDAGDQVMIVPSGSGTWWSARMETGREDLVAVLKGLEGLRPLEPAGDRLTDYEAMRIYLYQDTLVGNRVLRRWESFGIKSRQERESDRQRRAVLLPGVNDPYLESRAAEAYMKVQARSRVTLNALARALAPLGETRERKAVILVSEGFVFDPAEAAFRNAVEASRRANTPVYFVDTRGLEALSSVYSAELGGRIDERDLMSAIADVSREGDGSELLATETGGFSIRRTNDLVPGLARIGRESQVYYLLGYDPPSGVRDGRYRRITVRVARKGLTVRARRGYYAPAAEPTAARGPEGTDLELQRAFDSPLDIDAIPLRMAAYVLHATGQERTRVLMAADVDVSRVAFQASGDRRTAGLDVIFALAHRDSTEVVRNDQKVDLEPKTQPGSGPAWYSVVREFDLRAGTWQARLVVRDVATRRLATVTLDLEVPSPETFRVSTPILTDVVQWAPGLSAPAPVLLARRTFPSGGLLYCRFDVFGMATDPATGRPRVTAGHSLRRTGERPLSAAEPSLIQPTSLGALSRVLQIPLLRADPGEYELTLTVRDELTAQTRELVEPFTVTAPSASAQLP